MIFSLSYFWSTKFKFHYVAPQFFIFQRIVQIAPNFLHWNAHIFLFGLILRDIPNSITPQNTVRLLPIQVGLLVLPCTHQCRRSPLLPPPLGTCARDRRALQQFALNVHVKHSDLTWPDIFYTYSICRCKQLKLAWCVFGTYSKPWNTNNK